ncbi:class I SAM-dependent methyltransferase [Natranaerobius thermophilus]|uniref:Methyltransferase type 11 n=1 Tax=Natranaerobius thermophilus (strain ATCC BAA-1301 / DSM 18059 / JW/NM-WN-LF) TaxID=457570 RepID=B2A8E9_NATTJ|nr:class I SAM-dependent methyltransferase [Natranaerobius thermophilus]ACB85833.1 Methyltransferase type 11 [Natranaerobius thermophilus JW/NM-WN-LF]
MNWAKTEERVIPKKMSPNNGTLLEHIARYELSKKFSTGRVLDIACGVGYGSKILASSQKVREVLGVDLCPETIEYARNHYNNPKVSYRIGDTLDETLPEKLGTFDCVVSLETMEHVEDEAQYLANMYRLTEPGGLIIISTPFGRGRDKPCNDPYHVHQLTEEEFEGTMKDYFGSENVTLYRQLDETIELPLPDKKYYLGIGVAIKSPK